MSLPVKLHQTQEQLRVEGALVLDTVPQLEKALKEIQPPIRQVDLAGVTQVDSSALAWLLSLCALSGHVQAMSFQNPPKSLRMLAQLYELDFLKFVDSDTSSL